MFERLLQLPLFQGLTTKEISEVMAHVRLDFVNYHAGDEIVIQGDACRTLIFVLNGEVEAEYRDEAGRFTLTETLPNIKVIEPYNLFGMYQKFSRTYTFTTEGITLSIAKSVMLKQLIVNDIIKINTLNIVCNKYQQTQRLLCHFPDDNVHHKIVRFLLSHSTHSKGKKDVQIKMTELANIIHETRLNVSNALNAMQDKGHATLQRGGFTVNDLQDLYQ